ncbi:MAG: hypothetical protein ACRD1B_08075 [Thermoanaerobaculia bacterium]
MSAVNATSRPRCWGIYRELAHSRRKTDDAEILRATARQLAARGFDVELKTPHELPETRDTADVPPFLFVMCERIPVVARLAAWERQGVRIVNRPEGIHNTHRECTIALFARHGIPFPQSVLVPTAMPPRDTGIGFPCWVKRGDVHGTQEGDVRRVADSGDLAAGLSGFSRRGIARAVVQEHVPGDLIKFYGVAGEERGSLSWFQWFYHRDQQLSRYPFDPDFLAAAATRAAVALGLDVFGGDAIAMPDGRIVLIDLNAWPSFALYRDVAASRIASCLAARFRRPVQIGVSEGRDETKQRRPGASRSFSGEPTRNSF